MNNTDTGSRDNRIDGDIGDLLTRAAVRDPYANFEELRQHDPAHWSQAHRAWLITRHADVNAGFRDSRLSSDRISGFYDRLSPEDQVMMEPAFGLLRHWHVFMDPPDHTRLRRLVQRAFTPKMIALKEPRIREIISGLIGATADMDSFDFIREVAYPLPAIVIAEMLGVPPEDRELFKGFSDEISALVFGATTEGDRHSRAINGMIAMTDYLNDLIAHYSAHPGENLITDLVNAHESGERLSSIEVVATCALLLFGGHETTTNLLASGTLALLQQPDALDQFIEQPEIIGAVVEELLRFDGPAKLAVRVAVEPIELHGAEIQPLDRVFLVNASANRDRAKFDHADVLDFNRAENPHIGFGLGLHHCLGASLARLEARITFDMLRPLMQSWHVDTTKELEWHPTLLSRGLIGLPLTRSA